MLYADPFLTVYCCLLAALLGACMGSFLNCAAWRIVHGESVLRGRSHCDACGHVLAVRDLIPVVSYLAAHGRCRYCGAKLSRRHVLAEAVSALVFVTLLLHYDISLQALEGWCVAGILLVCSFADLEGYIIPDRFIAVGVVLFIITLFFAPQPLRRALDGAIGGLAVAGCVLLLVLGMEKLLGRCFQRAVPDLPKRNTAYRRTARGTPIRTTKPHGKSCLRSCRHVVGLGRCAGFRGTAKNPATAEKKETASIITKIEF